MFTCGTCWRKFSSGWQSRQQHIDATGHHAPDFECDTCGGHFGSQHAVEQHMNNTGHWDQSSGSGEPEFPCDDCDDTFYEENNLRDHKVKEHFYCDPCGLYFQDWNSINQHLHSRVHNSNTVQCLFCSETRATATGLAHHLERGSCSKAPLNRDKLYEAVRSRDPNGVISKNLVAWSGTISYEASEKAWNYHVEAYECYFCHHHFRKLASLNQHLNSPVHQQKFYHCPNLRCGREFTMLAAVVNHLESESCGYMRFEAVQKNVERILDPRRMIQL